MGRLDSTAVVVTGAGSGIGRAFVNGFAREGAKVGVLDLDSRAAESVVAEITAAGGSALALSADVTDRDAIRAEFTRFHEWAGSFDVLFNNAGFNKPMPFLDVTEDNWNAILRVNSWAVLMCTQEAAKFMIPQGHGKIVNTASVAGRQGYPDFTPYSASKFAVNAITQATARELAKHGITCNSFSPGVVVTPLWDTLDKDLMEMGATSKPKESIDSFSADIIIGHPAEPEELVGTALYLASHDSDYLTGQTIMIDGGKVLL
ncbi:MAG: SDR family oxidoreductase [Microbacteriaceae bacterium]|nr:SDR family oxidoreductase [Microbacteriaceae bacterium]